MKTFITWSLIAVSGISLGYTLGEDGSVELHTFRLVIDLIGLGLASLLLIGITDKEGECAPK